MLGEICGRLQPNDDDGDDDDDDNDDNDDDDDDDDDDDKKDMASQMCNKSKNTVYRWQTVFFDWKT